MLNITILCIGRLKDAFFLDAAGEYLKRLKPYARTEILELPAAALPENPSAALVNAALEKEAETLLRKIPANSYVVALCVEGKSYSSEAVARLLADCTAAAKPLVFIIGGSHGLAPRLKTGADARLSMSAMTFPHRLARIMLLEQIYRGFTINAGKKYHK